MTAAFLTHRLAEGVRVAGALASVAGIALALAAIHTAARPNRAHAQTADFEARAATLRAAATASGWTREDVVDGGRIDERWCPAPGPCAAGVSEPTPDVLVITHWGLSRSITHRRTAANGWRVTGSLAWWEGNPPTFTFHFERGADELDVAWELHSPPLPDGGYFSPLADDVGSDFHAWMVRELGALQASPSSFRERVLRRSATLRAALPAGVATASVCDDARRPGRFVCVPSEAGHAMMDTCVRRGLTRAERAAFRAQADAELDARDAIVRAHATELYAALLEVLGAPPR